MAFANKHSFEVVNHRPALQAGAGGGALSPVTEAVLATLDTPRAAVRIRVPVGRNPQSVRSTIASNVRNYTKARRMNIVIRSRVVDAEVYIWIETRRPNSAVTLIRD